MISIYTADKRTTWKKFRLEQVSSYQASWLDSSIGESTSITKIMTLNLIEAWIFFPGCFLSAAYMYVDVINWDGRHQ